MLKYLTAVCMSILTLQGCNTAENTNNPSDLRQEVMDVHDEAMTKMQDIHSLTDQLQKMAQIEGDPARKDTLMQAVEDLEEADEAMMEWMRNYRDAPGEWSNKEKLDYYLDQKQQIIKVQKEMDRSIERAKELTDV